MTAIHLIFLAVAIGAAATRVLPRAGWVYRAPGLGLAAWYGVLASVALSVVGAVASLFVQSPAARTTVCAWWALCANALSGRSGPVGQVTAWLAATLLAALVARAGHVGIRHVRLVHAQRQAHLHALRLVGRPGPADDTTVIDHEQPAAYALPGQGRRIVITSGALSTLTPAQVAAVLAHERAHTARRHHWLLTAARILAAAFPAWAVACSARRQIDRLVELHADDVATRRHPRIDLARALVACAQAATSPDGVPVPAGAAAVHGGDTLERIHRLLDPPAPLPRRQRAAITSGIAALHAAPAVVITLGLAVPGLGACLF